MHILYSTLPYMYEGSKHPHGPTSAMWLDSDIGPGLFPRLHGGEAAHYSGLHGVCLQPVGGAREGD